MAINKSKEIIDLSLFDVVAYLDDRGIFYRTAGSKNVSAGWIGTSCPYCGDRSTHLGINLRSKVISCYRCSKAGTILTFIQTIENCNFNHALSVFSKFLTIDGDMSGWIERKPGDSTKLPGMCTNEFLPIHDKFLKMRRYDREFLQRKYGIMAVGPTCDSWKFRIIIPVFYNNDMVTYIGRDTTGKMDDPYRNAPIEHSKISNKDVLYGIDEVKDTAILVEGVLDKWRMGAGTVSTFGTKVTDNQLRLLKEKRIHRCCVLFDKDAVSEGETLAFAVSSVVNEVFCIELESGDPDDLEEDDVWEIRREVFK